MTEELRAILEALYQEEENVIRTLRRLQVKLFTGELTSKLQDMRNETYKYICSADRGKLISKLENLNHAHHWLDSSHADAIRELKSRFERCLREKIFDYLTRDCELGIQYSTERTVSDLLRFDEMDDRFNSILEPHPQTFDWIFEIRSGPSRPTPAYLDWLYTADPLFWISGKPGSGKSILMKHLSVHEKTRMALRSPVHRRWGGVVGYFSFWNLGQSPFQRNEEGLLRSLIYQVLCQTSFVIQEAYSDVQNSHLTNMDPLIDTDSLRTLENLFAKLQMILNHQEVDGVKFCFFIDGLDEYDGSLAEAINLIRRLLSLQRLKLCISSRHLPLFEDSFGLNDWNRLKMEDINSEDIKTFVTDTLLWDVEPWLDPPYSTMSGDFEQEISAEAQRVSAKAQEVFLWAVFVVPLLKEGMANGHRGLDVVDVLESIPSAPEECFKRILFQHIRDQNRADIAKMVKVTLEARCSLPLLTYWFIRHRINPSQLYIAPVRHREVAHRSSQMVHWLQSQCHGFFVVRK